MTELAFHPLANLFPLIEGREFDELVDDIRQNGFRAGEEIVLLDGQILDGRNRYRALSRLVEEGHIEAREVDPEQSWLFVKFEALGLDGVFSEAEVARGPLAYVVSRNLRRRHLTDDQREMVAARIAAIPRGAHFANGEMSRQDAADMLSVNVAGVDRAKVVVTKGAQELQDAVDARRVTVRMAADLAALPIETQREIVASADPKAIKAAAKKVRGQDQESKKKRRKAREQVLGELQAPTGKFGIMVEDFEWDHMPWSRETGMDRHAANHYPVSEDAHTAEEIVKRTKDRFAVADDNCVLWMWATVQHLAIAIDVLRQRGFAYASHYIWGKDKIGLGHWNRNKHEVLLIGVKGNVPCPAPGTQWDSLLIAPRGEHSEKPDLFLEMIEAYFPTLPKIELNARRRRPGWEAWGLEAPEGDKNQALVGSSVRISDDPGLQNPDPIVRDEAAPVPPRVGADAASPEFDDELEIPNFLRRQDGVAPTYRGAVE